MLPAITREQMILVDDIMVNELDVKVTMMMEHTGEALARHAVMATRLLFREISEKQSILFVVLCGTGNNAGGGLVAARRLKGWGLTVRVVVPRGVDALRAIPKKQLWRARMVGVSIEKQLPHDLPEETIILDAYIGYGYSSRKDPLTAEVFDWLREQKHVLSLDAPSGLDVNDGVHHGGFSPFSTVTLAFVKIGLLLADPKNIGNLVVADIGVPSWIYQERLGLNWNHPFRLEHLHDLEKMWSLSKILHCKKIIDDDTQRIGWVPVGDANQWLSSSW